MMIYYGGVYEAVDLICGSRCLFDHSCTESAQPLSHLRVSQRASETPVLQ
jgi:hypothetical protein